MMPLFLHMLHMFPMRHPLHMLMMLPSLVLPHFTMVLLTPSLVIALAHTMLGLAPPVRMTPFGQPMMHGLLLVVGPLHSRELGVFLFNLLVLVLHSQELAYSGAKAGLLLESLSDDEFVRGLLGSRAVQGRDQKQNADCW